MRGATLLELVFVLALAGILAAVAAPRLIDRSGLQLAAAERELTAGLRLAQRLALTKNREVCVDVLPSGIALRLNPNPMPGAPCSQAVVGEDGQAFALGLPVALNATPASFRFRTDGQPQPAPIDLVLGETGQDERRLQVVQVTGAVQ